ncbi:MAG: hypothetical protein NHG36_06440 [Chromatiaceae bacterium]|nr:hypothetical protein [Candidatus Thioaporhodococcus sediminis]
MTEIRVFGLLLDDLEQREVIENLCSRNRTCGKLLPEVVNHNQIGKIALCNTAICDRAQKESRFEFGTLKDGRKLYMRRLKPYTS